MTQDKPVTFQDLVEATKREDWDFVELHIDKFLGNEYRDWALGEGLKDSDHNVRDLAASILDEIEEAPSLEVQERLIEQMCNPEEYHIVRYRLAVALFCWGNKDPRVMEVMREAAKDPDVGDLVKSCLKLMQGS